MNETTALLIAGSVLLVSLFSWVKAGGPGYRVIRHPTPGETRLNRWIHVAGGVLALCACLALYALAPSEDEVSGFRISGDDTALILPLFFVWIAVAGAVTTALGALVLGGRVSRASVGGGRIEARAADAAERAADRSPRLPIVVFALVACIGLAACELIDRRCVVATTEGLEVTGLFSETMHAWSTIDHLVVARVEDRGPQAPNAWELTWMGASEEIARVSPGRLWWVSAEVRDAVVRHHQELGIPVR